VDIEIIGDVIYRVVATNPLRIPDTELPAHQLAAVTFSLRHAA
jgi:hypothetical protein